MGRSNSAGSDTRMSVFWKVERAPNKGKNCFGCTSRDAGQSRVPAPPHMISGMIRLVIASYCLEFVIFAVPFRKPRNTFFDRGRGSEPDVSRQILDISKG